MSQAGIASIEEARRRREREQAKPRPFPPERDKIRRQLAELQGQMPALEVLEVVAHVSAEAGLLAQALLEREREKRQGAVLRFYAHLSMLWSALGLGTWQALDQQEEEHIQGQIEIPPRASVAYHLANLMGDVGEIADLGCAWWGADLDEYRDQIGPTMALLAGKLRILWEMLEGTHGGAAGST
jgi:hypothetical protein